MRFNVRKIQVWSVDLPDRPGAAAGKLQNLAQAGVKLSYLFTRPHPSNPELTTLFLAPLEGSAQIKAGQAAGFSPAADVAMLAVEGQNQADMGLEIMEQLAVAGINLRGLSISALGDRFVAFLAFDNCDMANQALRLLSALL